MTTKPLLITAAIIVPALAFYAGYNAGKVAVYEKPSGIHTDVREGTQLPDLSNRPLREKDLR